MGDIQNGKEADLQEVVQVMVGFMAVSREKDRHIKELELKVHQLEKKIVRLETQQSKPDILAAKRGILIRGFEEATGEDTDEDNLKKMLSKGLEIPDDVVESVKRVPLSNIMREKLKSEKKKETRPLLVRFKSTQGKFLLFKNIHKLGNVPNGNSLKVSNDIPYCLKNKNAALEAEGRKIRHEEKGLKTRVVFEGMDIKLQVRKPGEKVWNDVAV